MRKIIPSDDIVEKVISMYLEIPSMKRIQRELKMQQCVVKRVLIENDINLVLDKRDRSLQSGFKPNKEAFTDFSDERTLYFYGLILADGNLSKDYGTMSIALKRSDKPVLEELALYLGTGYKVKDSLIKNKYPISDLSVRYYMISDNLVKQGLKPSKSMKESVPNFYDHSILMKHFWRGFVDGDGSVIMRGNTRGIKLLGSLEIISAFKDFVEKFTDCKNVNFRPDRHVKDCYRIEYSGRSASSIAKLLYEDSSVSLTRKKINADKLIELYGLDFSNFNKPTAKSKTGISGVSTFKRNNKVVGYKATWVCSIENKQKAKCFGFAKYGEEGAFREAVNFRNEMLEIHYNK